MRRVGALVAATAALFAQGIAGATAAAPAPAIATEADDPRLDAARRGVRAAAEWMASGIDSWFGNIPFKDGGSVSDGRLSLSLTKRQGEDLEHKLRFDARFKLPNVEASTYLFIGRDNPRELVTDTPAGLSQQRRLLPGSREPAFFAGLGRAVGDAVDMRVGFRGGLKPYVQARYHLPWLLDPANRVLFRQSLFWSADERLGSTTALSYDHAFSRSLALRWLNAATITQDKPKFEWNSNLGLYQELGDQRQLSLELLASGRQSSGMGVSDYGVQSRYTQPLHKDWLLGEVVVGHFWPRSSPSTPRGKSWALGGGLTLRF